MCTPSVVSFSFRLAASRIIVLLSLFAFLLVLPAEEFDVELATEDGGRVVWARETFGYEPADAYTTQKASVCLDPDDCYVVTVHDSDTYQDGLTGA